MTNQVAHPMVKLQRKMAALVDAKVLKPEDSIWKIALLYGEQWGYWKQELLDFGFTMQDPIKEILVVESWEED